MRYSINTILSVGYILFIGISSAVLFVISLAIFLTTVWFDKRRVILNLFASFWACLYIWLMPLWSVTISGRHKMDFHKGYVLVSNHQSQLDILVLYRLFFPFRWVSKAEVFNLPFIGWNMVLNGYIKLKRGNKESVEKMMQDCRNLLADNISVFFFPEGTRSKTGVLRPFKPGAFILAKEMKKSILPVVINHTRDALPKHSLRFQGRHQMAVTVLDEIPFSEFENEADEDLAERVRSLIGSHVPEHQARPV